MSYRILVVDDELMIRQLIQRHLAKKGYQVDTASDGREALEAIRKSPPDLMILDIKMPNMDGMELLGRLQNVKQDMVIMVLTAYDDLADQAASLGVCDYITKPFDLDYLESRVMTNLVVKAPFRNAAGEPRSPSNP